MGSVEEGILLMTCYFLYLQISPTGSLGAPSLSLATLVCGPKTVLAKLIGVGGGVLATPGLSLELGGWVIIFCLLPLNVGKGVGGSVGCELYNNSTS